MQRAINDIRSVKKAPGVEKIFLPGEREYLAKMVNLAEGIPIGTALAAERSSVATYDGVPLKMQH